MTKHRFIAPTIEGEWHRSLEAAQDAAVRAGHGYRDPYGKFFPGIFVKFESAPDERDALRAQLRDLEDKARSERYAARGEALHSKASRDAHARARMLEAEAAAVRLQLYNGCA